MRGTAREGGLDSRAPHTLSGHHTEMQAGPADSQRKGTTRLVCTWVHTLYPHAHTHMVHTQVLRMLTLTWCTHMFSPCAHIHMGAHTSPPRAHTHMGAHTHTHTGLSLAGARSSQPSPSSEKARGVPFQGPSGFSPGPVHCPRSLCPRPPSWAQLRKQSYRPLQGSPCSLPSPRTQASHSFLSPSMAQIIGWGRSGDGPERQLPTGPLSASVWGVWQRRRPGETERKGSPMIAWDTWHQGPTRGQRGLCSCLRHLLGFPRTWPSGCLPLLPGTRSGGDS